MSIKEYPRFQGPCEEKVICKDWQGSEICEGDQYIEFDGGDKVLFFPENVIEYLKEHMELTYELLDSVAVKKEARNE